MAGNFDRKLRLPCTHFRVLLHAANMRHGTGGFTSLTKGSVLRIFFSLKNPTTSAGVEPANLGTKGQHSTSRPPKPLRQNINTSNSVLDGRNWGPCGISWLFFFALSIMSVTKVTEGKPVIQSCGLYLQSPGCNIFRVEIAVASRRSTPTVQNLLTRNSIDWGQ